VPRDHVRPRKQPNTPQSHRQHYHVKFNMPDSNSSTPTSRHSNIREDFERCRSPRPSSPSVQLVLQQRRGKLQQQQHQDDVEWKRKQKFQSLLDEDDDDDFMLNIVHGSCQRLFDHTEGMGSIHNDISRKSEHKKHRNFCQDDLIPGCQMTFEDHLDLFTVSKKIVGQYCSF
jgi:hypothetical protein